MEWKRSTRPPGVFGTLVRHFFSRFFDTESLSPQGEAEAGVIQTLGILAVPGALLRASVPPSHSDGMGPGVRPLPVRLVLHDGDGLPHGLRMGRALPGPPRLPGPDAAARPPLDALPRQSCGARHLPVRSSWWTSTSSACCCGPGWMAARIPSTFCRRAHDCRCGQRSLRRPGGRRAARRADHRFSRMALPPRLHRGTDAAHGAAGDESVPDAR